MAMPTIPDLTHGMRDFLPAHTKSPRELGDEIARLVWESFSDFLAEGHAEDLQAGLGMTGRGEGPDQRVVEEILIFLMWSHTRAVQMAFIGRTPEELIRQTLDSFHEAVFDDLVTNGTPPSQLPFFEQRVGARYDEYYVAAAQSDGYVGLAVLRHLGIKENAPEDEAWTLAERAIAVAFPLKDFLDDVEITA